MPDRMSPHLAEAMLVVEDMPILKRINVMVGITRNKVILVVVHLYDFVWEISALGPLDAFGNESLHFPN